MTTNEGNKKKSGRNKDIFLMIISVFSAVIVWFLIMRDDTTMIEKTFTGIVVEMDSKTMESQYQLSVIQKNSSTVSVMVSGKRSDIKNLRETDILPYLDLKDVTTAGDKTLPVEIKDIDKITVESVTPSNITLYIDKTSSKEIPVQAVIKQAGYEDGVTIIPMLMENDVITVTGPAKALDEIEYAQVDLYLGSEVKKAMYVREQVKLMDEDNNEYTNQYVTPSVSDIEVYISVTTTKKVPLTLKYKYGYFNEHNTSVQITPDSIEIKGSPDYLNTIDEISLDVINERLIEDDIKLIRNIPLPEGVSSGIGAAEIDIKFINSDKKIITLNKNDIKVTAGEFEYLIMTEEIPITVRGSVQNLSYLTKSRITASIDLSKITEKGIIPVTLTVAVTNSSSVYPVGEYVVNVEVY